MNAMSGSAQVLVVDDKESVRSYMRPALVSAGYAVLEADDYLSALRAVEQHSPDLIILDIVLEDPALLDEPSGLDLCLKLRRDGWTMPIVFCSRLDPSDSPALRGWSTRIGADDYVLKRAELSRLERERGIAATDFMTGKDVRELLERVHARLPKATPPQQIDDQLLIDLERRYVRVKRRGAWEEATLAPKELAILATLLKHDGRPVGKQQLMAAAGIGDDHAFHQQILRLRQKLEPDVQQPRYVRSYKTLGYSFRAPET
jgi:DNA-binding response OmpR family regulator